MSEDIRCCGTCRWRYIDKKGRRFCDNTTRNNSVDDIDCADAINDEDGKDCKYWEEQSAMATALYLAWRKAKEENERTE